MGPVAVAVVQVDLAFFGHAGHLGDEVASEGGLPALVEDGERCSGPWHLPLDERTESLGHPWRPPLPGPKHLRRAVADHLRASPVVGRMVNPEDPTSGRTLPISLAAAITRRTGTGHHWSRQNGAPPQFISGDLAREPDSPAHARKQAKCFIRRVATVKVRTAGHTSKRRDDTCLVHEGEVRPKE